MTESFLNERVIVELFASDIFVPQKARCQLWKACVVDYRSLDEVCREIGYDFSRLVFLGFNANFLTRERWLDIKVLVEKLKVGLDTLVTVLGVTPEQQASWNLTADELKLFGRCEKLTP